MSDEPDSFAIAVRTIDYVLVGSGAGSVTFVADGFLRYCELCQGKEM